MKRLLLLLLAAACAAGASAAPPAPRRAVPLNGPVNVDELLRLARVSQAINARTYLQYSFRQTTRTEELDDRGETERQQTKVYRVIPSREGTIRHLLEQDGEEPSPRQVKKQQARNEKVRKRWAKIRQKQEKSNAKKRAELERRPARSGAQAGARTAAVETPAAVAAAQPPPAVDPPNGNAAAEVVAPAAAPGPLPGAPPPQSTKTFRRPLPAAPLPEPDPAEFPVCDLADPAASLRPPVEGSVTRSGSGIGRASDSVRKARESTGDYTIFELLSLTNYEYEGTCRYEDRIVHVLFFEPASDFDPQNPVERVVTAMQGTIFIDAADMQVMRTEARTLGPIKWGAGMVALRAAEVHFEARKVNDEVWLPAVDRFMFDTRVLFDKDRQRFTHYYDEYRKLSVSSSEDFVGVVEDEKPPG